MTTEQQQESEELRKLISDRFDQIDRRLETQINELKIEIIKSESKLSQEIIKTESQLHQEIIKTESKLNQEIAKIKVDTTWIKWLFGGLLSLILLLLSVIITVLFKLVR
jgi:actin-related protein